MNHAEIRTRCLERIEADPADPQWKAAATAAINEGLRLFAFLTLCLEASASFTLTPGTAVYHMLPVFSNWLLPLRVDLEGSKLRPATLYQMAALDASWLVSATTVRRYGSLGWDLLFLDSQPQSADTLDITYARSPAPLVADGDTPEIHDSDHEALVHYGVARLRTNEGGQELQTATLLFQRFLMAAKARAEQVKARSLSQGYDRVPTEIQAELMQTV